MYNYVKENGYDGAAIKCESNTGAEYSVGFFMESRQCIESDIIIC